MASPFGISALKGAKVLMVGAGGIGCELLKTLVLTGFEHIELIDMDTIEVSNLNRQFLFRKRHVGQSKAKVAREAILNFRPDANIVAHHANVKSPEFDVEFFQQFNVVLNGLDNLDARRHVNRLCLAAGVPLVESGTTGYLGQVTVHVKGRTDCYECQPKQVPKTFPTCTITNTPSKPVHCIVWAKELPFAKLFGSQEAANDIDFETADKADAAAVEEERTFFQFRPQETPAMFACRVFDRIFGLNISETLTMEDLWKDRQRPIPLYLKDVFPGGAEEAAASLPSSEGRSGSAEGSTASACTSLGLKNPQQMWGARENTLIFLESIRLFFTRRSEEIGSLTFDKDDQLAVEFVASAANLRAHSFGIPTQTLFDAKGIAGNIIHAIATTNAIISGMIVLEALKLLNNRLDACSTNFCEQFPRRKMLLWGHEPFAPNPKCYVCSETPLTLEVNTTTTTLGQVIDKALKRKIGVNLPTIFLGNSILYEAGDDLEEDEVALYTNNAKQVLAKFGTPIVNGSILKVEDFSQNFKCIIYVKHRETFDEEKEPDGMAVVGTLPGAPAEAQPEAEARTEAANQAGPSGLPAAAPSERFDVLDDDDVVFITNGGGGQKRKRDTPNGSPAGPDKKMKSVAPIVVEDEEDTIML